MLLILFFLIIFLIFIARVFYLLYYIYKTECNLVSSRPIRSIMCIGSGGHTMELLRIVKNIDKNKYKPRLYILAANDTTSEVKIRESEEEEDSYELCRIPRSRKVQQSYLSSICSTLYATLYSIPIIYNFRPNVIFCNGPGTCLPVCAVAFLMRCLYIIDCRIVFVESVCRVHTLSLTGKILQFFADVFVVQWPELKAKTLRAKYFGRLV